MSIFTSSKMLNIQFSIRKFVPALCLFIACNVHAQAQEKLGGDNHIYDSLTIQEVVVTGKHSTLGANHVQNAGLAARKYQRHELHTDRHHHSQACHPRHVWQPNIAHEQWCQAHRTAMGSRPRTRSRQERLLQYRGSKRRRIRKIRIGSPWWHRPDEPKPTTLRTTRSEGQGFDTLRKQRPPLLAVGLCRGHHALEPPYGLARSGQLGKRRRPKHRSLPIEQYRNARKRRCRQSGLQLGPVAHGTGI